MPDHFEIAIIGAGPAGLTAAANAAEHKISHVLFERKEIGNTIYDYQLKKYVMAEPGKLPLRGKIPFVAGSREAILQGWNQAVKNLGVNVVPGEVAKISKGEAGFTIIYGSGSCTATHVILCIGMQGTPRKLGVPGEDSTHVNYTLVDPAALNGLDVLVVGAGDSAIENALGLCDRNKVSILNRSAEFARAKEANVAKISEAIRGGKVRLFASATVTRVEPDFTYISTPEGEVALKCNHIIARLGGVLPRKFLEAIGITFSGTDANAVPMVDGRYESSVKGVFILGALIGYPLIKQAMNQGYEVIEHILGNPVEPADQILLEEKLKVLPGRVNDNLAMLRAKLPLFKDLTDPQFREMVIDSTIHLKNADELVFQRNDYTDTFFSVVSGSVKIDISPKGFININEGNYFGEMGLLSGRRRSATVRVGERAVLLETPRKQILKLISSVPSVKRVIDEAFMLRALQTSIFPEAEALLLAELVKKVKPKNFKKGELLFKEGDSGEVAYIIRKGSVKISRRNKEGQEVAQTYIPAGNLVGEMALLTEATSLRSASVSAAVACETLLIDKADFLAVLNQSPAARERIARLVRERQVENITQEQNSYRGHILDFMMAEGVTDADNFLLIDSDLCIACDNCEKACAATHHGYSRLDRKGGKTSACIQIPISCRHCENPLCMLDCPPDALTRMPNGEVVIRDSCIGCGNCTRNCPYGVIQLVYDKPKSHGFSLLGMLGINKKPKEKGPAKAAKCDMCGHLDGGPACVRSCPTGAAMRVNPKKLLQIIADKRGGVVS